MGGSAGGGAESTAGVFGVPPKPGAAYAGTFTAAVGIAISTPATAILLICLRTSDDVAQVIDRSLHRALDRLCCHLIDRCDRLFTTTYLLFTLPRPSCAAGHKGSRCCHDALNAAGRALLACAGVGQHNGLPASIVVTTTLRELEAGVGQALTGGGSLLPMSDVIRLAWNAHHYLCTFDKGKAIALYHTKRLASPGQRIVLYAKDR